MRIFVKYKLELICYIAVSQNNYNKMRRECQLEDGKLILDLIRNYFNVPYTTPPKNITLSKDDKLYIDISAYFKEKLKKVSCNITSISILQNRTVWER